MTETLAHNGFTLSEIATLKEEIITTNSDRFDLLISDANDYTPPELESVTLQDKLQEISILNEVHLEDSGNITPISGIEATDVCSLYEQFLEYEQASDAEPLSYTGSSVISPNASPGAKATDAVLDRLKCVQEQLSREVAIGDKVVSVDVFWNDTLVRNIPNEDKLLRTNNGIQPKVAIDDEVVSVDVLWNDALDMNIANEDKLLKPVNGIHPEVAIDDDVVSVDVICNDALVMNIPNEDKLLRTINGIHPKGNLLRMADSPKFAKFKKKRLTNEPPLRIASSLPNTPRCTSPSETVSSEERKHMEIKLIEALALPAPKQNIKSKDTKNSKDIKSSKDIKNNKDIKNSKDILKKTSCPIKRKQPPAEPIPSRLLPVVSKRQRNNLDKTKNMKDPRLKELLIGNVDPRLNRSDYCSKTNVIELKCTNLKEINSSTNTATETVDDVSILDMASENLPEMVIVTSHVTINHDKLVETVQATPNIIIEHDVLPGTIITTTMYPLNETVPVIENGEVIVKSEEVSCDETVVETVEEIVEESSELKIIEFPSISAIEVKTEDVELADEADKLPEKKNCLNGLIKPERNYRKAPSVLNGSISSDSERECDEDDRPYNRKKLSKNSNSKPKKRSSKKRSHSSSISVKSRSRSLSKTPASNSRPSSRHHSRSPSRERSRSRRRRSLSSERPMMRSERPSSDSSFSGSDRSDSENMDISNKLIELSNPVPYDIEHERKLRFLSGGASKGMGERRNIYAGGITEDTTKAELGERFRRFGKISKITLHFREKGDNYAFIVFEDPDNAMRAIEEGNDDPTYPPLDLCFGGRRKFVGGSYVDFDGNNRYLEESDKAAINNRCEPEEDDFDRLLQMAMIDSKKRETTPEWS